jgi:uroporphyrinogen III methyltransferase/synthase
VERFFDAFFAAYEDARSFGKPKIAAIGPATARKIAEYRFATDLLPETFVAEGLVEAFKNQHVESQTVLWVKAEDTREIIYDKLMEQGAIVDRCIAYRNVPETGDPTGALESLTKDGADVITFTSGSTVESFFALGVPWPEGCKAASIGPVTSGKLREHGIEPEIEAAQSNIQGLLNAILEHYQS